MDGKKHLGPDVSLVSYTLRSCNAERVLELEPDSGGDLQITNELHAPSDIKTLKPGDKYTLRLGMKVVGKLKDTEEVAFFCECMFEGLFSVTPSNDTEVAVVEDIRFWALPFSQISPIVSQYITDTLAKMGLRDIVVPPAEIARFVEVEDPPKKKRARGKAKS
ncbi:hypothetical protein [Citrifermentans bremense]|uniref:Preprotein translocase subunit SecB n=1 Tax=Citrifermentans bremense TaxID=60035 RepID=A0A6S6LYU3_9BACT|nr:hypothetical protein [Citrifermentans bremense]